MKNYKKVYAAFYKNQQDTCIYFHDICALYHRYYNRRRGPAFDFRTYTVKYVCKRYV